MVLAIYPPCILNKYRKVKVHYTPAIEEAVEELYKACAGLGTDEAALVKVLGTKSSEERAMISFLYKEKYNTTLRELVKGETSGDFGYLLQLLSMSMPDAEAFILYHAMAGVGTTDNLIYPIVLGRSNEELDVLKKAFYEHYDKDLTVMLDGELSGDYHTVIMTAMQEVLVEFKGSFHTSKKAEEDAETIYGAGEGKWGTDSKAFIKTLLASPPQHVKNINKQYIEKYGHDLVKAIDAEFSGVAATALKFFVRLATEPWELLADQLHKTMAGMGTDENKLSMLIVRFHPYLGKVKTIYEDKFKLSLREHIHTEANGKYGELLLHVLEAPVSVGGDFA